MSRRLFGCKDVAEDLALSVFNFKSYRPNIGVVFTRVPFVNISVMRYCTEGHFLTTAGPI